MYKNKCIDKTRASKADLYVYGTVVSYFRVSIASSYLDELTFQVSRAETGRLLGQWRCHVLPVDGNLICVSGVSHPNTWWLGATASDLPPQKIGCQASGRWRDEMRWELRYFVDESRSKQGSGSSVPIKLNTMGICKCWLISKMPPNLTKDFSLSETRACSDRGGGHEHPASG